MAEATKLPVKTEKTSGPTLHPLRPFESLRREVDRLFEDFAGGIWRSPCGHPFFDIGPAWRGMSAMPAVDVTETDKGFEITAELPGMEEKNIEVSVADGVLTIKGEKQEEKEEKKKDYYLSERSYGSFQRSFEVPKGVDLDKIEASFKKGVLTVNLPKSAEGTEGGKENRNQICIRSKFRSAMPGSCRNAIRVPKGTLESGRRQFQKMPIRIPKKKTIH